MSNFARIIGDHIDSLDLDSIQAVNLIDKLKRELRFTSARKLKKEIRSAVMFFDGMENIKEQRG